MIDTAVIDVMVVIFTCLSTSDGYANRFESIIGGNVTIAPWKCWIKMSHLSRRFDETCSRNYVLRLEMNICIQVNGAHPQPSNKSNLQNNGNSTHCFAITTSSNLGRVLQESLNIWLNWLQVLTTVSPFKRKHPLEFSRAAKQNLKGNLKHPPT